MTFLKKLGLIVLKIVGIASGVMPLVEAAIPQTAGTAAAEDKLAKSFDVIVTVEQAFAAAFGADAKKGSDKLKAAVPFVAALIQKTDLLIGKHPKDEALFADAVTRLTAALADILNSYGD